VIIDFALCFVVMLLLHILTPWWWWIMIVPFIFGVVRAKSGWYAFLLGISSAGLLWLISSTYYYFTGSMIIAHRVTAMVGLGSPLLLIILTSGIAALAGGVACSAGFAIRGIFTGK
jgi:hypothetical protein